MNQMKLYVNFKPVNKKYEICSGVSSGPFKNPEVWYHQIFSQKRVKYIE